MSYEHCIRIAQTHYENFPVLSRVLPRRLRPHVAAVYAFARAADDFADEGVRSDGHVAHAKSGLAGMRERIEQGRYGGDPVFEALGETIHTFDLPDAPFLDLLSAFEQDVTKTRYETFDEVLDYCRRSADPVGRLVLMLMGYRDEERCRLSDRICTALQLANFWQDVRSDYLDRGRIYIPGTDLRRFGVSEEDMPNAGGPAACPALRELIDDEVRRTLAMMREGWKLIGRLSWRYRWPVAMFAAGGTTILERTSANAPRPTLGDFASRLRLPFEFLKVVWSRS